MRPELRDKLLQVADRKLQQFGMQSLEEAVDKACVGFEKLSLAMTPIRTRQGLIELFDRVELTEAEEIYAIPVAEHFPHVLRELIIHLFESALRDLPPQPAGRKRSLSFDESAELCSYVAELFGKLPDLKACKKRAAQRFGVSLSTVERAWRKRGENSSDVIQAAEVVDYIKANLFKKLFEAESAPRAVLEECKEIIALPTFCHTAAIPTKKESGS